MRQRLEKTERRDLAPWALRSTDTERRLAIGSEGRAFDYRTAFQRDRDRIVYSRAFRRLRQKAQTGTLPEYEDHRRNRLTHTLEVVQLSRTLARALRLNEDLVEAIGLAHDLGQPPFGPTGERALADWLSGRLDRRGGPGLGNLGGFACGWQGLRVVDRLEKRYAHPGLNLTDAVREGVFKSAPSPEAPEDELEGVRPGLPPSFESQVVMLADRIASALHDLDDALQAGVVDVSRVERLAAVRALRAKLGNRYPLRASRFVKANAIHRNLTHLLVTSAIVHGERSLGRWAKQREVRDHRSFLKFRDDASGREIDLPPSSLLLLEDLEGFLRSHVHRNAAADRVEARGRHVVLGLAAAYVENPTLLEAHVLLRFRDLAGGAYLRDVPRAALERELEQRYRNDPRFVRIVADFIAGMTDAYAIDEHGRLLHMGAVPIPGAEQLRRERSDGSGIDAG